MMFIIITCNMIIVLCWYDDNTSDIGKKWLVTILSIIYFFAFKTQTILLLEENVTIQFWKLVQR